MRHETSAASVHDWQDIELRNVLDVNFAPTNLGFLSAWLARRARSLRVRELGSGSAVVTVALPVTTPTRILLPTAAAFMQSAAKDDGRLEALFGDARATRLLVIHEARSADLVAHISRAYQPDIVCADARQRLEFQSLHGEALAAQPNVVTPRAREHWGLPALEFWANARGAATLHSSLALFDGFYQRRKHEATRVYDVKDLALCEGFHPVESESHNHWAWTGSDTVATLLIPSHGNARAKITLYLFGATIPIDADNIEVFVDDRPTQCQFFGSDKIEITTGVLREGCAHRLDIVQSRTVATAEGSRQIGFALHKLRIDVLP